MAPFPRKFWYNRRTVNYKYLYQDKDNRNCEGWIRARDRNDAYARLRKGGIRPYRVIGDDPWNWRPVAIAVGYAALLVAVVVLGVISLRQMKEIEQLQLLQMEERERY